MAGALGSQGEIVDSLSLSELPPSPSLPGPHPSLLGVGFDGNISDATDLPMDDVSLMDFPSLSPTVIPPTPSPLCLSPSPVIVTRPVQVQKSLGVATPSHKRRRTSDPNIVSEPTQAVLPSASRGHAQHGDGQHPAQTFVPSQQGRGQAPVVLLHPTDPNAGELFCNPVKLAKLLETHIMPIGSFTDIRINKRKRLIVLEPKTPTPDLLAKLTSLHTLGQWNVRSYRPNTDLYIVGVITPISVDCEVSSLSPLIRGVGQAVEVHQVECLHCKVGADWVPSNSVKITFVGRTLPPAVTIAHSYYKVRTYTAPPLQCFRCQRLGHTAAGCTSSERCLICGDAHNKSVCSRTDPVCCNCRGSHKANSIQCPLIQAARAGPAVASPAPLITAIHPQAAQPQPTSCLQPRQVPIEVHHSFHSPVPARVPTY